jgi:hypothetical protein
LPALQLCLTIPSANKPRRIAEMVMRLNSLEHILSLHADAVMYAPLLPRGKEVAALPRSGKNVVTSLGWFYPALSCGA